MKNKKRAAKMNGKTIEDFKKVVPRLGGYHYEFQIGVLRLLDLIEGVVDRVEFESALYSNDFFDDIKVFYKNETHHYQVKWGMSQKKPIKINDFTNASSNLYFVNLFQTWKSYSEKLPNSSHVCHIYSSKKIDAEDTLPQYLIPLSDEEKKFSDNKDGAFKINSKILTNPKFNAIKKELAKYSNDDDVLSFINSLIIEVDQPQMPVNEKEEMTIGNPVRDLILEKISHRLGLDKFPNLLRSIDVLALLIDESYSSAIQRRPLTREYLASKIGIKLSLDTISQDFPFDKAHYVKTSAYLDKLTSKFRRSSGKLIGVVGLPGTGKSHLLTFWNDVLYDSGIKAIMYYCFIGYENHPDVRITQNQLLQNLISNILRMYPDIGSKENHSLLAATPQRLQDLLSKLGEHARSKNQTIPIIIDGLDHIGRTREKYTDALGNEIDILGFLKKIEIPEGVTLVIGSQPGPHVTDLKERFGQDNFIEIKGLTTEESKDYLEKFKITEPTVSNDVIKSVIVKSGGLPLLLAYSVQANREISFEKRLTNFQNISKELPKTEGDVKKYYDWLCGSISSDPMTCHYARLLSLIDFPASRDLLEKVISKSIRLGHSLDECLEPLVSISKISEEGISFFHDSFGTYVRSDSNFSTEDKQWYFENLYRYFNEIGLHDSDLAYVKGIDFAFRAQRYNEILNMVTLDFVDKSFMMAFPIYQILTQIDFAIKSAVRTKNIPVLVQNCVLRKYTKDRFDFNYPVNQISSLFIKLKKDKQLKRLIFSNDSLNTDLASTVELLSLCLENSIDLPYKDIMTRWYSRAKEDSKDVQDELKSVNKIDYVKIVSHVYGLEYVLNWIKRNPDIDFGEDVFKSIGKFTPPNDIDKLIQKQEYQYDELIIILNSLLKQGNKEKSKEILSSVFSKKKFSTPYIVELGISLGIDPTLIEKEYQTFVPRQTSNHAWDEEISDLYQLETSVKILSYCEKTSELDTIISTIKNYPLTSPRLLQEMMFLLATIEGKIAAKKQVNMEADKLIVEFERFTKHSTPPGILPRDFDCTRLQHVAKYILKKMVRNYLTLSDKPDLNKLIGLILKLNNKFEWHSPGINWIFVSTEHMISCLSVLLDKYPDNKEIKQKIIQTIETTEIPPSTGYRVDHFLKITEIYLKYGMIKEAETAFTNAIVSSHAYGYRKDLFLDEIHDIAINLNMANPSTKSLNRAADILELTKYLWGVTDHAETKFIPGNITKELIRMRTTAGLKLLKQFSDDEFELPSIECSPFVISEMKNAPLSLRWGLVKSLSYEKGAYDDENWLMKMKFELVRQATDEKQVTLAKEIMENIRTQILNEFKIYERKWEEDFKTYAKILKIKQLDLSGKSSTDSYLVDSKSRSSNVIKDGSVSNIIKQINQLDRKQYYSIDDDVATIFNNKIQTMSETELDELTEFLAQEPIGVFNSTCGNLLAKIALKYQGQNDEKYLNTMFLAFDTYGWIGYGYQNIVSWLVDTYNKDAQKTMDYILESFTRFSVEKYGPHGAIRRLSDFLYLTKQIDLLENLYEALYNFCKTFFRTYTEEFNEFHWLRGSNLETVDDEEIIRELIKIE